MVISQNQGPPRYGPYYKDPPKKGTPNFGNPHRDLYHIVAFSVQGFT